MLCSPQFQLYLSCCPSLLISKLPLFSALSLDAMLRNHRSINIGLAAGNILTESCNRSPPYNRWLQMRQIMKLFHLNCSFEMQHSRRKIQFDRLCDGFYRCILPWSLTSDLITLIILNMITVFVHHRRCSPYQRAFFSSCNAHCITPILIYIVSNSYLVIFCRFCGQ